MPCLALLFELGSLGGRSLLLTLDPFELAFLLTFALDLVGDAKAEADFGGRLRYIDLPVLLQCLELELERFELLDLRQDLFSIVAVREPFEVFEGQRGVGRALVGGVERGKRALKARSESISPRKDGLGKVEGGESR